MTVEQQYEAELQLLDVRAQTHALISQADPVLQDLRQQLELAKELADRLEGER